MPDKSRPNRGTSTAVSKAEPVRAATVKFDELGTTGLSRTDKLHGTITEEFLPQLSGTRAMRVYREMRDNDPVVSAVLFAVEMLLRNVEWRVEGDDDDKVAFIESCMGDMSHTWADFIAEVLSMLVYGFSWHEIIYKRRNGDSKDPSQRSRYSDGKIGWRKLPIRAQDTLFEWTFNEDGGVTSFVQQTLLDSTRVEIPLSRSLLFRAGAHKDNPEGRSLLRGAYRPWYFKKRTEEIEGIGVERDLAGLPVIYRAADLEAYDEELKRILRNVRRDEQEGLLLPLAYDANGNKLLEFALLSSAGNRQLDTDAIINRYNKMIASTCLADFILLGQQAVGSFALASSKTSLFATALGAILAHIAETFNRYAVMPLLALNSMQPTEDEYIGIAHGDIESPDLGELSAFISSLASAGMPLFPDDDLEAHLRTLAGLPHKSEDAKMETATGEKAPKPKGKPAPKPKVDEDAVVPKDDDEDDSAGDVDARGDDEGGDA